VTDVTLRPRESSPRRDTVFEWYDFYLYGSLAGIIGAQFFSSYPPATRDIPLEHGAEGGGQDDLLLLPRHRARGIAALPEGG
jgi:hypothetical protein